MHGLGTEWWETTGKEQQHARNGRAIEMQARARHARTGEWPDYWKPGDTGYYTGTRYDRTQQ